MRPLTDAMPKPMAPFRGTTLIANGMEKLAGKLDYIHITVGYKGAMLAQHVIVHGAASVFCTEGKGNCWWIYNTLLKHLDEPVYVLTCDNVVDLDFGLLETDYNALDCPPCMIVPVRPMPGLEGDFVFHEASVVTELTRTRESEIYCSGIQVLNSWTHQRADDGGRELLRRLEPVDREAATVHLVALPEAVDGGRHARPARRPEQ